MGSRRQMTIEKSSRKHIGQEEVARGEWPTCCPGASEELRLMLCGHHTASATLAFSLRPTKHRDPVHAQEACHRARTAHHFYDSARRIHG
jgi:hypothetical protein